MKQTEYKQKHTAKPLQNKYRNQRTVVDGITFASKKECLRYAELKLLETAGYINDLTLQPRFPLIVMNVKIGVYVGDFCYNQTTGGVSTGISTVNVVEDVKGIKTPVYRLKKKLVKALYGIEIKEI